MKRLYNLDYFRGMLAFLIMIYHYFYWAEYKLDGATFLGKVGLYGVTGFYVLSGLTLYYVYESRLGNGWRDIKQFFKKRALRILPLLIIVTLLTIALSRKMPQMLDLALNITGTFGFFKWDTYFAVGAWSIGNELVFYAFFPFLMFLLKKNKIFFFLFFLLTIASAYYFSGKIVADAESGLSWWKSYVNPLNQIVYFTSGIFLGVVAQNLKINTYAGLVALALLVIAFVVISTNSEKYLLVTGIMRVILSLLIIGMVLILYKTDFALPRFLDKISVFYGDISYSLYLYHPIVFSVTTTVLVKLSIDMPVLAKIAFCIITSTVVSYISYEYFEKRLTKLA